MKAKYHILTLAVVAVVMCGFPACSDDDFTESIFDTTEYYLDKSSYTFPLDTFIKVEFLEPYNLRYIYKMEDIGTDLQKNLVPATYEKSTELAVLSKYLWYDVYKKCVSEEFLKIYSPRIIHVVGSPAYNPSSGTEDLGYAEGGLKITLYNANNLDVADIDYMNDKFFRTMHHEFSHILAQNYTYPTAFSLISNGAYNPIDWSTSPDSVVASKGFV
ncbi:MAG: putative zinc-binding metallopeptidase, partial [Prevotella sp.]|nr:putative zinc-binding metallopeptidase [Prevotella sp.]